MVSFNLSWEVRAVGAFGFTGVTDAIKLHLEVFLFSGHTCFLFYSKFHKSQFFTKISQSSYLKDTLSFKGYFPFSK